MSTRGVITFEGVIRFHAKSRTGCLTCRKRKVKCDETAPICKNCHRRNLVCVPRPKNSDKPQQQQESALSKPLTAPTPSSFTVDATSLGLFHHYMDETSASYCTNPTFLAETRQFLPQLIFSNPVCMHAALSFTALHMGRLHEPNSSSSSQNLIARASAHQRAGIRLIPSPSLPPEARFMAVASLSLYVVSLSLSLPSSSPESIFPLVTLLHNVCSPLKQFVYADPWLKDWGFGQPGSSDAAPVLESRTGFLAPLHHLCDISTDLDLDPEELDDLDIKEAYRTAVLGLSVAYFLSQIGHEARSALFWPALVGRRFVRLLNKRKQRALVILYYYLLMLRNLSERCWWVSEAGRWVDYVYGLIDERWREWLRHQDGSVVIKSNPVY
ncbi:c6 transcription factor [Moniliophthora roreri MCA 2997]|uniref:C6 transcription factor n=1 Tax=Moniliophthora roreri (strain MCA 2997) TaxID=1381753 RepID=V2W5T2_MONRO|nr:c6 transcription factor [Moniliophthora roreri MCA 2997]